MNQAKYFDADRGPDLRKAKRTGEGGRRTWAVSQLWDNHKEMARRIAAGQRNTQIAAALGCTPTSVSLVRNSPATQEQVDIIQGKKDADSYDVLKSIRDMAPRALKVLDDIISGNMENASPALKANTARDILDRAGFAPAKNVNIRSVSAIVSAADLDLIKRRAMEIASNSGAVIDV